MIQYINSGLRLLLSVSKPKSSRAVIFSHGFLSNKNKYYIKSTARALARAGFKTVRFNYPTEEIKHRVSVLNKVIDEVKAEVIGLVGCSLGGMTSIITASHPKVKSLVLVNSVYDQRKAYENYVKEHSILSKIAEKLLLKDFFSYNLKKLIQNLRKPVLVVSGEHDRITPQDLMKELYNDVQAQKEFLSLDCGHSIWRPLHVSQVRESIRDWFLKTLNPSTHV